MEGVVGNPNPTPSLAGAPPPGSVSNNSLWYDMGIAIVSTISAGITGFLVKKLWNYITANRNTSGAPPTSPPSGTSPERFSLGTNTQQHEVQIAPPEVQIVLAAQQQFLYLARKLTGDPSLHFVVSPALAPPEVQIDLAAQQQHATELMAAASQPLPNEDDDTFE